MPDQLDTYVRAPGQGRRSRNRRRRALAWPVPGGPSAEAGFTMIEVLASAIMVIVIGAAVATSLIGTTTISAQQRRHSQAAEIAQQDQARLQGMSSDQLNDLNQTRTVTVDNTPFTVTSTATFLNTSGGNSCGSSGSGAAAYYRIASSVNWQGNTRGPVLIESVVAPAAGGTLFTQVNDQTGAGLSGATVTASGPDYASGTTGAGGCTVFANLAAGSFTVTVADQGYVDPNGNSANTSSPGPLSLTSTVTSTGLSTPSTNPVVLGQAGTINANFTAAGASSTLTGQEADGLAWYGKGSSNSMSSFKTSALSPSGTQGATIPASGSISLFPFYWTTSPNYSNNYHVWGGICQQMEPPSGIDTFSVSPGSSQTLAVQEPALQVFVYYPNSTTRVAPTDVKLSFASSSGTSCTDSWYAPIASDAATDANGSLAYPGQPFASTATSGSNASASGFTGSYSVCADYKVGTRYATATSTGVQNNSFSSSTPNSVTIDLPTTTSSTKC